MKLKDFLEKSLDYDLDLLIVKDNGDGTSSDVSDVLECVDAEGNNIVSIKFEKAGE